MMKGSVLLSFVLALLFGVQASAVEKVPGGDNRFAPTNRRAGPRGTSPDPEMDDLAPKRVVKKPLVRKLSEAQKRMQERGKQPVRQGQRFPGAQGNKN